MAMSGSGSRALHEEEGKGEGGSGSGGGGKWIPEASTSGEGEPRRRDDWPALRTTSSFGREYTVGTVLGKGSFGEVFVATKVADGVKYAVKKIKPAKRSGEGIGFDSTSLAHDREAANREAALMKRVAGHSSVISITDHVQDDAFVYIVMEHCAGGDLMKYILNCHRFVGTPLAPSRPFRSTQTPPARCAVFQSRWLRFSFGRCCWACHTATSVAWRTETSNLTTFCSRPLRARQC